ncbi:MAG TPA: transposase [Ktedonobacteraceae bacterium]|nr:transposase [Ktedonobacteraceae bacterium]
MSSSRICILIGQPAYAAWRLALVTVFQFMENLTDRQAADAVRSRLDWKYALSLELTDPGFDHTVLSEFRTRLVALSAEERFLEAVIELCKERGWLKAHGHQRTDSTHVLAKIRAMNRTECVVETLRHALNVLAVVAPEWLRNQVQPEWLARYGARASDYRFPSGAEKRQQFEHQVGQDGWGLLTAIKSDPQNQWMLSIPAVDTLERIWKQDYLPPEEGGTWIADEDRREAAKLSFSPYDLDASASTKRSTHWIGDIRAFHRNLRRRSATADSPGHDHHWPDPRSSRASRDSRRFRPTGLAPKAAPGGCWICGCGSVAGQSEELPSGSDRSHSEGLSVASARTEWLRFN